MLRILFALIVLLHGLIHFLGFVKAFEFAKISQLSQSISKPTGLVWLFAGLLFGVSVIAFLFKKDLWWTFGLAAVVLSQILIFLHWQDAKFGSVANLIVLLICLTGFGRWQFDQMVKTELNSFLSPDGGPSRVVTEEAISHLPNIVQLWLRKSNVIGTTMPNTVHLVQSARMKLKPDADWMKATAEQWFTIGKPGFIWNADVGEGSIVQFSGRDKMIDGKGNMLIKLFSVIPIVDADGESIDQGVMVRYLSEIIWFPSAALSKYIVLEEISPTEARAVFAYNDMRVDGVFTFSDKGYPLSFEAKRYYGETNKLETWFINIDKHHFESFNKITVPTVATVTWKLKNGDFTWFEVKITKLEQN